MVLILFLTQYIREKDEDEIVKKKKK